MMTAIRTFDTEMVESFMAIPEIWVTIAEDGQIKENFKAYCESECWLLMMDDKEFVGMYNLHAHTSVMVEIHAHVLPKYRAKYSQATGTTVLQWIIDETKYEKVIAVIPTIYENVKRFTCSFGFKEEGVNRHSYMKNGEIVDQWLLGITRDEILTTLNESKAA